MSQTLTSLWGVAVVALGFAAPPLTSRANGAEPDFLNEARRMAETALASENTTIAGTDGWMYFAPELRHLGVGPFWGVEAAKVSRATKSEHADPLPAIVNFRDQLARAGIELMLVPVPPKAVIYPEFAFAAPMVQSNAPERFDIHHQQFYAALREAGVHVVDLVPEFLAHKSDMQLFCRQDTHWTGAACVLAAQLLAAEIRQRSWFGSFAPHEYFHATEMVEIDGDLRGALGATLPPKETLPLRFVGTRAGSSLDPIPPDPASPVILLGDSHNLVFHGGADLHAVGAGLPDQLALELGLAVDLVAVRGSGATPARVNLLRRAKTPGYLAGKKLVIWCFAAREFTESSGWMKVPVVP